MKNNKKQFPIEKKRPYKPKAKLIKLLRSTVINYYRTI